MLHSGANTQEKLVTFVCSAECLIPEYTLRERTVHAGEIIVSYRQILLWMNINNIALSHKTEYNSSVLQFAKMPTKVLKRKTITITN